MRRLLFLVTIIAVLCTAAATSAAAAGGVSTTRAVPVLPGSRTAAGQSSVSGTSIRVGTGSVDVAATHHGSSYTTTVTAGLSCTLHVGATVPAGAQVHNVTLNGSPAQYTVRDTNAGREVLVSTPCRGQTWTVHAVAG